MSSRESILHKLRAAPTPFEDVPPVETRREMVPNVDDRLGRFVEEVQKLSGETTIHDNEASAIDHALALIGEDQRILSWDPAHIPLAGLSAALEQAGITIAAPEDGSVRVGLTGADAALAATGSVILCSGPGKARTVSLLPDVHIVVLTADQIVTTLEVWAAQRRAAGLDGFRQESNVVIVSGASRTADIAMQLVLGAHGPAALHVVILNKK